MGDGNDNLTFDGGGFLGVTEFNGGDDASILDGIVDTLTFRNVGGTVAGATMLNWENVVIGSDATLGFSDDQLVAGRLDVDGGVLTQDNDEEDHFALTGDLGVANDGSLVFEFFTATSFDTFNVSGVADFGVDSMIDFLFSPSFLAPSPGTELTFLTSGGISGFGLLDFSITGLNPSIDATLLHNEQLGTLSLSFSSNSPTVPAPPTLLLFASGLAGLLGVEGLKRRRRRKSACPAPRTKA